VIQTSKSLQVLLTNCSPAKQPSKCSSAATAKRPEPVPGLPPSPTGPVTRKQAKSSGFRCPWPLLSTGVPSILPDPAYRCPCDRTRLSKDIAPGAPGYPFLVSSPDPQQRSRPRGAPRIVSSLLPRVAIGYGRSRAFHDPVPDVARGALLHFRDRSPSVGITLHRSAIRIDTDPRPWG